MKKFLVLIILLFLFACSSKPLSPKQDEIVKEYIEPTNDVEVFQFLNSEIYELLYKANNKEEIKSDFLECFGKELIDYTFTDYYGDSYSFADFKSGKLIIEVSAHWCTHCMKQASEYNDQLLAAYPDVKLIQYFNEGSTEQINAFYKEINRSIPSPEEVIVVPSDDNLSKLLINTYKLKYYPDFLIFNDGILTFERAAELTKEEMDLSSDIAFNNGLDLDKLVDKAGNSIFSYRRTSDDVKNDLRKENYKLLEDLDNDSSTISQTLNYMGRRIDYADQLSDESKFKSEVKFEEYSNENVVIFFLGELEEKSIQLINDYYDGHNELKVIVLNTFDENCTEMAKVLNPPVTSIMNQVPKVLNDITFVTYPSCIFVEKGIITGIYSNIENIKKLNDATSIFMGDHSIALKSNN